MPSAAYGLGVTLASALAFLVFPSRTQAMLGQAFLAWTGTLRQMLEAGSAGAVDSRKLMVLSQSLDRAYRDMTEAARPLGVSWQIVTRSGNIRQSLLIVMACTYWARLFARGAAELPAEKPEAFEAMLAANIEALRDVENAGIRNFFTDRPSLVETERHIPLSRNTAILGMKMIGASLARLQPMAGKTAGSLSREDDNAS